MRRLVGGAGVAAVLLVSACNGASTPVAAPAPIATHAAQSHAAMRYLRANFRGTTWLRYVTGVRSYMGELWVSTSLYPDADAPPTAKAICSAVSGFELTRRSGFTGVRVAASGGQRLSWRQGLGDAC